MLDRCARSSCGAFGNCGEFDVAWQGRGDLLVFARFGETDQELLSVETESIARGGELTRFVPANVISAGKQDSRFFGVRQIRRNNLGENLVAKSGVF